MKTESISKLGPVSARALTVAEVNLRCVSRVPKKPLKLAYLYHYTVHRLYREQCNIIAKGSILMRCELLTRENRRRASNDLSREKW